LTQITNALSWQEQSDPKQPLANYLLNFGLDPNWQFTLPGMYHFQSINPAGVTIDNSAGAGTITLQSAAFSVNILPFSREDIDLSNASQQVTITGLAGITYSVPIVFWLTKPSGAQQNQFAINQAVQSALITSVLGNMQPIINSGFTEWPQGLGIFLAAGPLYTAEGWMAQGSAASNISRATSASFPTPFLLQWQRSFGSGDVTPIVIGSALTSQDSAQYQGQIITFALDIALSNLLGFTAANFTVAIIGGTGTDQNVFTPFTAVSTIASRTFTTNGFQSGRYSFTSAAPVPSNVTQLGIRISFIPVGNALNDAIQFGRPQLDTGTIAQQFRTVPEVMERDRCLAFFERLNGEAVTNFPYGVGQVFDGTTTTRIFIPYKRKRAIPSSVTPNGTMRIIAGGVIAISSFGAQLIGQDRCVQLVNSGAGSTPGFGAELQDNAAGASFIDINARM
jgi:hypothetical protein